MISYARLVDLALASHNPRWKAHKIQYASMILAHDEQQLEIARARTEHAAECYGAALSTRVEPLKRFWLAEDYHQKYYLRNDAPLMRDFHAMFDGDELAFRESTSAARVNGYVAGDGTRAQLAREIEFLGLSAASRSRLVAKVGDQPSGIGCSTL